MPKNLTIKGIPDEVYERLKYRAEENMRSMNNEVIMTLKERLGRTPQEVDEIISRAKKLKEGSKGSLSMEEIMDAIEDGRP